MTDKYGKANGWTYRVLDYRIDHGERAGERILSICQVHWVYKPVKYPTAKDIDDIYVNENFPSGYDMDGLTLDISRILRAVCQPALIYAEWQHHIINWNTSHVATAGSPMDIAHIQALKEANRLNIKDALKEAVTEAVQEARLIQITANYAVEAALKTKEAGRAKDVKSGEASQPGDGRDQPGGTKAKLPQEIPLAQDGKANGKPNNPEKPNPSPAR